MHSIEQHGDARTDQEFELQITECASEMLSEFSTVRDTLIAICLFLVHAWLLVVVLLSTAWRSAIDQPGS